MKAKYPPLPDDPCYTNALIGNGGYCFFDDEQALMKLLQERVCSFGSVWDSEEENYLGIGVFVNCNDLFYWACADGEIVTHANVENIYRHYVKDPKWGVTIWACKQRGQQPQMPIKKRMIEVGVWTEELEKLKKDECEETDGKDSSEDS